MAVNVPGRRRRFDAERPRGRASGVQRGYNHYELAFPREIPSAIGALSYRRSGFLPGQLLTAAVYEEGFAQRRPFVDDFEREVRQLERCRDYYHSTREAAFE